MNTARFVAAVVGVWIVRVAMNFLFYGLAMAGYYEGLQAAHPGVFREVISGFVVTDLLFAAFFVFLWTRAAAGFGGGVRGGATYGAWIGAFFGIVMNLYYFFGFTFVTMGDMARDAVYTIVSVAIQGAVAAAIYRIPEVRTAAT